MGGGVPAQDANTFGVALQLDNRVCEWRGQPAVRDLPDLFAKDKTTVTSLQNVVSCSNRNVRTHSLSWRSGGYHDAAVFRAAGDDVVVVRTELDVQDRPCVAAHSGVGHVDPSCLQREKHYRHHHQNSSIVWQETWQPWFIWFSVASSWSSWRSSLGFFQPLSFYSKATVQKARSAPIFIFSLQFHTHWTLDYFSQRL